REQLTDNQAAALLAAAPVATPASNDSLDRRAAEILASLCLNAQAREARLTLLLAENLRTVRDAHNAGFAPGNGVREKLLAGLARDLTPDQIEIVKDKITIGQVPFTYNAYHDIVPDLTAQDDAFVLARLKDAREECLDVKNAEEMSAIFEKYKKQIEQYLDSHGHN